MNLNSSNFQKDVDENLLYVENLDLLQHNPDSKIKNFVLYSGTPLYDVHLKGKLTKSAPEGAKIIITKLKSVL